MRIFEVEDRQGDEPRHLATLLLDGRGRDGHAAPGELRAHGARRNRRLGTSGEDRRLRNAYSRLAAMEKLFNAPRTV